MRKLGASVAVAATLMASSAALAWPSVFTFDSTWSTIQTGVIDASTNGTGFVFAHVAQEFVWVQGGNGFTLTPGDSLIAQTSYLDPFPDLTFVVIPTGPDDDIFDTLTYATSPYPDPHAVLERNTPTTFDLDDGLYALNLVVFANCGDPSGNCYSVDRYSVFVTLDGAVSITPSAVQAMVQYIAHQSAHHVVSTATSATQDAAPVSQATRNAAVSLTRVQGTTDVAVSTRSMPGLTGNLYTWAEITGFYGEHRGNAPDVRGSGVQIGADVALGPNVIAGISLGHTEVTGNSGAFTGLSHEGTMTYLQPYLGYSNGAWHGTASLTYGRGAYDQTSILGAGSAETELFALSVQGGYDFALDNGVTLTPTLGLLQGHEEVTGTSGTLLGSGTQTHRFTQASLGMEVSLDVDGGSYFAGFHADHLTRGTNLALTQDLLAGEGWTGRVEFGGQTDLGQGLGINTSVEVRGLGGEMRTVSGGLRVALTF
ncbi:hypothetical protein A8B78_06625 [Jannaschia sp. EhC01]|nr:hypothetical protein A8B78_06625 [Jannaschia sp. EhC01]